MTHVNSLEEILRNAKKPVRGFLLREEFMADTPVDQRISFSSVSREDLDKGHYFLLSALQKWSRTWGHTSSTRFDICEAEFRTLIGM